MNRVKRISRLWVEVRPLVLAQRAEEARKRKERKAARAKEQQYRK